MRNRQVSNVDFVLGIIRRSGQFVVDRYSYGDEKWRRVARRMAKDGLIRLAARGKRQFYYGMPAAQTEKEARG